MGIDIEGPCLVIYNGIIWFIVKFKELLYNYVIEIIL